MWTQQKRYGQKLTFYANEHVFQMFVYIYVKGIDYITGKI